MRPSIGTNRWLFIISTIALVVSVLSSPIRAPQAPNSRVQPNFLPRNFALASNDPKVALTSAAPARSFVEADYSDFEEKDEDEWFWSFSDRACPTFIPADSPPKLLSGPCPGNSPPRTAAVPLRC